MKNLVKGIICLSVFFQSCIASNAQKQLVREPDMKRPFLFQNLPDKINCRVSDLSALFELNTGRSVSFPLTDNLNFQGVISSVAAAADNTSQSLVIRSANFPGAAFSISKIFKEDKTITYVGRIISFQHGDAYEINQENGQYYFVKKNFYDLINE